MLRLYFKVAIFQPYLKVAIFQPELWVKSEIFQPELQQPPRATFVLKSCNFPAGAAGARSAYYVCT